MKQRRLLVLALGARLSGHTALLRAQTSSSSLRRVGVLALSTQAKEEITLLVAHRPELISTIQQSILPREDKVIE